MAHSDASMPEASDPQGSADSAAPDSNTLNTDAGTGNGLNRCPRCGATDTQFRQSSGMLMCQFCRFEWNTERVDQGAEPETLSGTVAGTGAADIDHSFSDLITLKCTGCGSEVVVNTENQLHSNCHWCHHVLTVNTQIPNGAVPDALLPFQLTHADAVARIKAFVAKRRTFANRKFLTEFRPENVVGVYLPYLVIDGNISGDMWGVGRKIVRKYTVRNSDDSNTTYYDVDHYRVYRHVDFTVDDLTIESSQARADFNTRANTNNIINTILPFDTENAVHFDANYLKGFTSERRDQNIADVVPEFEHQLLSIARSQTRGSVQAYDGGVRWEQEALTVHGSKWLTMYLPVWLYSYYERKGGSQFVHYVAVNGRTGETMGSVPVSHWRLAMFSLLAGTVTEAAAIFMLFAR